MSLPISILRGPKMDKVDTRIIPMYLAQLDGHIWLFCMRCDMTMRLAEGSGSTTINGGVLEMMIEHSTRHGEQP